MSVLCKNRVVEDLVRDARVEPVEAGDDVCHVQERPPVLHDLEHKELSKSLENETSDQSC